MLYLCRVISQSDSDKRSDILQAALKLFAEFGFHGTPTSKIAQAAGVANGTLFHYFKTKEELITCLYIQLKTNLAAYAGIGKLGEGAGVKETSKWVYLNALHWALQNPDGFRFIQQFASSPFLSMVAPEEIKKQTEPALALIGQGISGGEIKPLSPKFVYTLINSHIYGISEYLLQEKLPENEQTAVINNSWDMLWKMLN